MPRRVRCRPTSVGLVTCLPSETELWGARAWARFPTQAPSTRPSALPASDAFPPKPNNPSPQVQARLGRFHWKPLMAVVWKSLITCSAMTAACWTTLQFCDSDGSFPSRLLRVVLPFAAAVATFFVTARLCGLREPELLFRRNRIEEE